MVIVCYFVAYDEFGLWWCFFRVFSLKIFLLKKVLQQNKYIINFVFIFKYQIIKFDGFIASKQFIFGISNRIQVSFFLIYLLYIYIINHIMCCAHYLDLYNIGHKLIQIEVIFLIF
jgi:hypothetical protein